MAATSSSDDAKEAWDERRFIELYNEVAERRLGWPFEEAEDRLRSVRTSYALGAYRTLREYAESRFEYEQLSE